MTQNTEKPLDRGLRLILSQDCKAGEWVHLTTTDSSLHGYWNRCIGVRVGVHNVGVWLEMGESEDTDLYHIEIDDTMVVASHDPRGCFDRGSMRKRAPRGI